MAPLTASAIMASVEQRLGDPPAAGTILDALTAATRLAMALLDLGAERTTRVSTKHGPVRVLVVVDVYFAGHLEILGGRGCAAVRNSAEIPDAELERAVARAFGEAEVVMDAASVLRARAEALASALNDLGEVRASVWSKKGVRVYVEDDEGERGYLEVVEGAKGVSVRNRSSLSRECVEDAVNRARARNSHADPGEG